MRHERAFAEPVRSVCTPNAVGEDDNRHHCWPLASLANPTGPCGTREDAGVRGQYASWGGIALSSAGRAPGSERIECRVRELLISHFSIAARPS
jgi:hypothetical protein